jgi:hypothetical protein
LQRVVVVAVVQALSLTLIQVFTALVVAVAAVRL